MNEFTLKISKEDAKDILNDDSDKYEIIDPGAWEDDGKYSHLQCIFKYQDRFYSLTDSRSGSYFTDYWYEHDDWNSEVTVYEVIPTVTSKTEYIARTK